MYMYVLYPYMYMYVLYPYMYMYMYVLYPYVVHPRGASPYCLFPGCIVTWAWSLAKG